MNDPQRTRGPARPVALLFFVLLPLLLLGPTLVSGRALVPADIVLASSPWRYHEQYTEISAQNGLLVDQAIGFLPWAHEARNRVLDGEMPLWNPHARCGRPLLANPQAGVLAPTAVFRYLLPVEHAALFTAWLNLFLAGAGAYLLLRALGLGRGGALFCGAAYALCSFNVCWLGHPPARVSAWLPWLVLATHLLLVRPGALRVVFLAVVLACQYLGGHPETSFHICAVLALFVVIRLLSSARAGDWRGIAVRAGALLAAATIALLLCAVQLLPFLEYLRNSSALATRQAGWSHAPLPPLAALTAFVPDLFGNPARGAFFGLWSNYCEATCYVGVVTLLLAPIGLLQPGLPRRVALSGLLAAALALAVVCGLPGLRDLVLGLPGFDVAANSRLVLFAQFGLALAAGAGVHALLQSRPPRGATLAAAAVLVAGAVLVWWGTAHFLGGDGPHALRGRPLAPAAAEFMRDGIIRAAALAVGALLVVLLRSRGALRRGWCAVLLLLLVATDLTLFGRGFNPDVAAREVFPTVPEIGWLAHGGGRGLGISNSLPPETMTWFGLNDVFGRDFMEPRWMIEFQRGTGLIGDRNAPLVHRPSPALNLLGVNRVLSPQPLGLHKVVILDPGEVHRIPAASGHPAPLDSLFLSTTLVGGADIPQDTVVAIVEAIDGAGEITQFPLRAGVDTAVCNDPPRGAAPAHEVPRVAFRWRPPPRFRVHRQVRIFTTTIDLPPGRLWREIKVRSCLRTGLLALFQTLPSPPEFAAPLGEFVAIDGPGAVTHVNPDALPRAFLAARAQSLPDDETFRRLKDAAFDPRAVVFVSGPTDGLPVAPAPSPPRGTAEIVEDLPEHVVIRARAQRPALLVLADTWFPGWTATVDGQHQDVLRAFGALRAVPVPEGDSEVVFTYRPLSYAAGKTLSLLGLLAGLIVGLIGLRRVGQDATGDPIARLRARRKR